MSCSTDPGGWWSCAGGGRGLALQGRDCALDPRGAHGPQHVGGRLEQLRRVGVVELRGLGGGGRGGGGQGAVGREELVDLAEDGVLAVPLLSPRGPREDMRVWRASRPAAEPAAPPLAPPSPRCRLPLLAPPGVVGAQPLAAAALGAVEARDLVQRGALLAETASSCPR